MYRVSQNTAQTYINQIFKPTNANRHLRSSNDLNYLIPSFKFISKSAHIAFGHLHSF